MQRQLIQKLLMTSQFDGHIPTDLKQEILYVIKTGNRILHDKEMYAALRMGMHGEKTTSISKDD